MSGVVPFLDVQGEPYLADPYGELAALSALGPVARSVRGLELLSYELVKDAIGDRRMAPPTVITDTRTGGSVLMREFMENGLLLDMVPERHHRVRAVMARAFSIRNVEQQRAMIAGVADRLASAVAERESFDVTLDLSHHLSIEVLCRYIGVPVDDIPKIDHATTVISRRGAVDLAPELEAIDAALTTLRDYASSLVALRTRTPEEDFITALLIAQREQGKLSEAEVVWGIVNLLFAGHDTTRFQLASAVRAIVEAGWWGRLAEQPDLVDDLLDEALRVYPVVWNLARIANEDFEIGGVPIAAGDAVRLNMLAASRDPRVFPEPTRFVPHRTERYAVAFGQGIHYCLGHALARAELKEALVALTRRAPDLRLVGEPRLAPADRMLGGPEALPVVRAAA